MLVSFSVANFRSIGEEVTLSMVASNKLTDHPEHRIPTADASTYILRTAVLYGANAAGKSNLIKAMSVAQGLIKSDRPRTVDPFRFWADGQKRPSSFEFRILISNRIFVYGFDIDSDQIISEWLAVLRGDDPVVIFQRDERGVTTIDDGVKKYFTHDPILFDTLNILKALPLRQDQLFLNRASGIPEPSQGATLQSIIAWFTKELFVLPAGSRASDLVERLYRDDGFKQFCSRFLNNVGTGIGELRVEQLDREATDYERSFLANVHLRGNLRQYMGYPIDTDIVPFPNDPARIIVRKLVADHQTSSNKHPLPFSEESDGTKTLLNLMPFLASPPENNFVVVIDELDRSLHSLICREFIRFFSDAIPGAHKQLIITTHEVNLLDQELLRRDEYWFVEKDKHQQTQLVSLSDFRIRKDLKLDKGYLAGRFGAIPVIGGMQALEKLLECPAVEGGHAAQETAT